MGKFVTLLMISLLLCSTLTYAAHRKPSHSEEIPMETYNGNGVGWNYITTTKKKKTKKGLIIDMVKNVTNDLAALEYGYLEHV